MDFLLNAFTHLDFNAELSFDAVKVISLFSAVFEELGRKFAPWTDDMVERSWVEIHGEHDEVCIKYKILRNILIYDPAGSSLHWRDLSFFTQYQGMSLAFERKCKKINACLDQTVGTKAFYSNSRSLCQRMSGSSHGI